MLVDSTFLNDSHPLPQPSSFILFNPFDLYCMIYKPSRLAFIAVAIINILLLLPLCSLILHHGFQQWHKCRRCSAATHSDSFTYHLVTMELIHIFGCILCICGIYVNQLQMLVVWAYLFSITYYGESLFHVLTCVEHYLAVVHPITYLSLREAKWIWIRSFTIACVWLLCLALTCVLLAGNGYITVDLCISISSVIMISFCSLSVLYVLIHPGPGDQGKDRVSLHQSKKRAFYTIVAILGVLMLRCIFLLVSTVHSVLDKWINDCELTVGVVWTNLPASLVVPVLYLHRTGLLGSLKKNSKC